MLDFADGKQENTTYTRRTSPKYKRVPKRYRLINVSADTVTHFRRPIDYTEIVFCFG